jgi:ubiquinone biosynthesis protein
LPGAQAKHANFVTRIRNFERMREIAEVAVRHGFGYFFERHRLLGLLPRSRKKQPPPPAQRGRHIREMFDELGPTFVKLGQLLSTRPDIVPVDIVHELVRLQDKVSPFPFAIVEQVVEADLGLTIARAFESFDPEPLASASIGQVHAAVLPGGERVVVKVQRPEAARLVHRDIDLMYQFAELFDSRMDLGFAATPVVEEFSRAIGRELDYNLEARNAIRFASNFEESPTVRIPRVYRRYSGTHVLTLERFDGPTLNQPEIGALPVSERKLLAETIASCWFKQILLDGFVHADPHPANIVYLGEGCIGLLDFGMAGVIREDDLEEATRLFMHIMHADILGVKRSLRRLGVQWAPSADEGVTDAIEEAFSRYFGASLKNVDVHLLLHQVFDMVYALRLRLPSRFLVLDKAVLTLEGVVSQLYPDFNLFEVGREFTDGFKRKLWDPRRIPTKVQRYLAEYSQVASEFPLQLHDLLEEMRAGELEIKYRHTGLENVIHRLDVITNRLVVALVTIALGVTGTAVGILVQGGPHLAGLSLWGLPGFAGSFFFGVWLVWAIIRSGRL